MNRLERINYLSWLERIDYLRQKSSVAGWDGAESVPVSDDLWQEVIAVIDAVRTEVHCAPKDPFVQVWGDFGGLIHAFWGVRKNWFAICVSRDPDCGYRWTSRDMAARGEQGHALGLDEAKDKIVGAIRSVFGA